MKYDLFDLIGTAENAIDRANLLVNDVDKFTRREAEAIDATLNKIQYLAERIMAVAHKKKPKVRLVVSGQRTRFVE